MLLLACEDIITQVDRLMGFRLKRWEFRPSAFSLNPFSLKCEDRMLRPWIQAEMNPRWQEARPRKSFSLSTWVVMCGQHIRCAWRDCHA